MSDDLQLVRRWLEILPEGRFDLLTGKIAADFVLRLPFAPPGIPSQFTGRDATQQALAAAAKNRSPLVFDNVVTLRTEDPGLFVTTCTGKATMGNGKVYANSYVMFTRLIGGMVVEHVEYLNPLKVIEAFGD
jgi:uncharacterized protein